MGSRIFFGRWEAVTLLINMICTKIFLNFPRAVAETAGTASWLLVLYDSIIVFFLFYLISRLYKRFEGKDPLDIGQQAGGSFGRITVGVVIWVFLIIHTTIILREFAEEMKVIAFSLSPVSFVTMFFLICMIMGAYFGIEAIMRFHAIIIPIIAIGYLAIVIAVLPFTDFTNLLPILGSGPAEIFGRGVFGISVFSELLILFLIAPFIRTDRNLRKVGYTALGVSTFFLLISAPVYIAALSYPTALENFLPIYQLARLINYGRFFQRVEPLFMVVWATAALLYLTASFYFIVYIFRKTFGLQYQKPLILPFAVIIFTLSLLPPNLVSTVELETVFLRKLSWIVTFAAVILLLLIARAVKRKGKKDAKGCG
jgi:spore germination protein (amino acid permease)